jgi:hypothetical protein
METKMIDEAATQTWRRQFVWGTVIIAAGAALLLDRMDQLDIGLLWRYWPVFVAIAGLSNLVPPTTPKLVLSGISCIGFAAWFYVSAERLWGLGFHNSWPILIILWGVKVVLKPILASHMKGRE